MAEMSDIVPHAKRELLSGLLAAVRGLTALPVAAVAAVAAAVPSDVRANDPVTAAAASTIAVDLRAGACRAISPGSVGYSPRWGGVTDSGAYVVIERVVRAGTGPAATNTLATCAADAEGAYPLAVSDGDERCVRLIHRVYSAGGVEAGVPLVRDVEFGYRSAAGTTVVADSRTNSLQLAAAGRDPVALTYSTAWATNAASVSIAAVPLSDKGGAPVVTNFFFTASADAEGTTSMRASRSGWCRLLCQVKDGDGGTLLEYLTEEFKVPGGFVMMFR